MSHYEDILIGAILSGCIDVLYRVESEDFTRSNHRKIFQAAKELHSSGRDVDIVSVNERVAGDFATLAAYTHHSPSLRFSALTAVKRARAFREAQSFNPKDFEAEELPYKLLEVSQRIRGMLHYDSESLTDIADELRREVPKQKTGFNVLDTLLGGGIERGGVFTIGGVPGDGKTAIATHMASMALLEGYKVHFVTLEMTRPALVRRIMKAYWEKPEEEIRERIDEALQMAGILTVSDTLTRLPDVIGSMSKHLDADIMFVDYAQRIRDPNFKDNRVSEIENVYGTIANFAREFQIPVVMLTQLNREYRSDKNDPPQMYHMKGSGAIEADSHIVGLLHNPNAKQEKLGSDTLIKTTTKALDPTSCPDERILFIRKNRNGPIGAIKFQFNKVLSMFDSPSLYHG